MSPSPSAAASRCPPRPSGREPRPLTPGKLDFRGWRRLADWVGATMGNAAGSAEQPAGPAAPSPKQPAAAKQPMPEAGELEERFNRVLVSPTQRVQGAGGVRRVPACVPAPGDSGTAWRSLTQRLLFHGVGVTVASFQSDLALSPQNFLLQ